VEILACSKQAFFHFLPTPAHMNGDLPLNRCY
jgi:hypothetical protein